MPRWLWRAFQIWTFLEGLEWIAAGVLCLVLAAVVWLRPIPPGGDALLLAAARYRNVGASLFAAFGLLLVGSGAREAFRASRERF